MAKFKRGVQFGFLGFVAAFVVLVLSLFILQHETGWFAKARDGQLELKAEVVLGKLVLSWVMVPGVDRYLVYRDNQPYFRLLPGKIVARVNGSEYTEVIPEGIGGDDLRLTYYAVVPDSGRNLLTVKPRYAGMVVWNLTYTNPNTRYQVSFSMPLERGETSLKSVLGLRLYGSDGPETADAVQEYEQGQFKSAWLCDGEVCKSWGGDYYQKWLNNDYSSSDMTLPLNKAAQLIRRSGQQNIKILALAGLLPLVPGTWEVPNTSGNYFVTVPVWRTDITKASLVIKQFPWVTEVSKWSRVNQAYITYRPNTVTTGTDYLLKPGEAIFVKVK
jgi:hypothetical protein